MPRFVSDFPLAGLRGADYNPRQIDEAALTALRRSLETLGVCKPIIVSDSLIVAGHQRTRSLRALGRETAPAILLEAVRAEDEIRFNQLHNGTDADSGDEAAHVGPAGCEPFRYEDVPADRLTGNARAKLAPVRAEICKLMERYGNWGGCVATMSGKVVHAAQYMLACMALGAPARVYRIPDELEAEALDLLGRKYGRFSYDHLPRQTYIQTFAQIMRLRERDNGRADWNKSTLYETRMLPTLRTGERVLDFGCGQADYVKNLRRAGVAIWGIEFFYRSGKQIDGSAVHRMIEDAARELERAGRFDVVLCDSVLNSVDSMQAEADVLTCVNAFCRPGGRIYFSGRNMEQVQRQELATLSTSPVRRVEFLDENGFSALYRGGAWFYQKFHTREQAEALARRYIGPDAPYVPTSSSWTVGGRKVADLPEAEYEASITREFGLPWPGGRTVGKSDRMLAAWRAAVRSEQPRTANSGTS